MLFAHYGIALPADYEMARIDARVAAKSEHWDRRPGLLLKAFTVAERAAGAPHNRYAPFYVWADPAAFTEFLTGPEYRGLSDGFGVVPVHTAQVLALALGEDPAPAVARWTSRPVRPGEDLGLVRAEELERHEAALAADPATTRVVALDPLTWQVHRLTLSPAGSAPASEMVPGADQVEQRLRIVHLARPAVVGVHH